MGPGRIAISRYGIPDIRILYDSDVRFLEQIAQPEWRTPSSGAQRRGESQ
jgi:hypothetical protein